MSSKLINLCKIGSVKEQNGKYKIVLDDKYSGMQHLMSDTTQEQLQRQIEKITRLGNNQGPFWAYKNIVVQDIENIVPPAQVSSSVTYFVECLLKINTLRE